MILIQEAIAFAVVLNLLLQSNHYEATANPTDTATAFTVLEVEKIQSQGQNNVTFKCDFGSEISLSKACDGYFDCEDGKDEECDPEKCDGINQCLCARTKECIQRNQSHFYLFPSVAYSHINVNPGSSMTLEYPLNSHKAKLAVNWYRNMMGVPVKCQILSDSTKSIPFTRLTCPNMTIDDGGVYTCEQYYRNEHTYVDLKVFINDSSTPKKDSCFCFGVTTDCQPIEQVLSPVKVELLSQSVPFIFLITENEGNKSISDFSIIEGMNKSTIAQSAVNGTLFYALSNKITDRKLELYQGSLLYRISLNKQKVIKQDEKTPMALMRGDGKVLVYQEQAIYYHNSHHRRLSFSKYNWHVLRGDKIDEESVSEEDIMRVLSNLDGIYIRINFVLNDIGEQYWNIAELSYFKFGYSFAFGAPLSLRKCSCPKGYTGNYCERCAENYTKDAVKNDSSCLPVVNLNNPVYSALNENYSTPHFHVKLGGIMILECPSLRSRAEPTNWYQNDAGVPSKCQITTSISPNYRRVSWLYCPNMTIEDEGIYSCEIISEYDDLNGWYTYFKSNLAVSVKSDSPVREDSCFCFGATKICQKTNVITKLNHVRLFSQSLSPIFRITMSNGEVILANYTIFETKKIGKISQPTVNDVIFYPLSEEITSMKLKLYGGSFLYKMFSSNEHVINTDVNDPLALMYDNDGKMLVYYESGKVNENSKWRKISFTKHNWWMIQGDNATKEKTSSADVMKILSNLNRVYIRVRYHVNNYKRHDTKTKLSIVELVTDGLGMPSSIGNCFCPTGYAGNYCEKCAEYYIGDPTKGDSCVVGVIPR